MKGLEDFKAANPGRQLTITKLDVGADPATTSDRVGAYLNAHPDTTAYIETGSLDVAVAQWLKDRGIPPGKVIVGGFDVKSDVLQEMKSGYIQAHADQQPYMQGFMPVMEVYLAKTVGLAPSDIDTGNGLVLPNQAELDRRDGREGPSLRASRSGWRRARCRIGRSIRARRHRILIKSVAAAEDLNETSAQDLPGEARARRGSPPRRPDGVLRIPVERRFPLAIRTYAACSGSCPRSGR